jgi:hypothetical protein
MPVLSRAFDNHTTRGYFASFSPHRCFVTVSTEERQACHVELHSGSLAGKGHFEEYEARRNLGRPRKDISRVADQALA